jgi:NAD(P)-dependent dehydrogenase (short-subunit alcohol dehydrogenase family)
MHLNPDQHEQSVSDLDRIGDRSRPGGCTDGAPDQGGHPAAGDGCHRRPIPRSGVKHILDEEGRIDVLVNAAGYGSCGAIEDVPLSEAHDQFEVNVFGA